MERDEKGRFTAPPRTMSEWFNQQFVRAARGVDIEAGGEPAKAVGGLDQGARGGPVPRKPTMSDFVQSMFEASSERKAGLL